MRVSPKDIIENESTNIPSNNLKKEKFTLHLVYCILITVIGGTFAVGWTIGEFNTPSQVITYINTV